MKKLLGCVAIGCLVPLAALVILGLVLPGSWSVQQSVTISAPPEEIHPYIEDFHRWDEWVRWEEEGGSAAEITISGEQKGVGSSIAWEGEQMGRGRLTILSSTTAEGIRYESAIQSDDVNGSGSITYEPIDGGTRIVWNDTGDLPPVIGGLFSWMVNAALDQKFGEDLARLKEVIEGGGVAPSEEATPPTGEKSGEDTGGG